MQSFRTKLSKIEWDFKIDYPSSHLLLGSCFSENIGVRLSKARFKTCLNPFGILYHPLVISRVVKRMINNETYTENDLLFRDERYISFDHHGKFNSSNKNDILAEINTGFTEGRDLLLSADYIYLTWGSAFAYTSDLINGNVVSNCHKIPTKEFIRVKSSVSDITSEYKELVENIHSQNPKAKIILSLSPVKHLRDGLIENNRSKAVLLLAAEELANRFDFVYYFPAFELVQDDLRDYRFYANDMAHPSEEAVEYIWNYFRESLWSSTANELYAKIRTLQQSFEHRPLHPSHSSYPIFLKNTLSKMQKLEEEFSFLDYSEEKRELENKITTN